MVLTRKDVLKIKRDVELNSLKMFFHQLKGVMVSPTGENSDKFYQEYFKFVKKIDYFIKRRTHAKKI